MWLGQISRACGSVNMGMHKIFNMRDFPQGHLQVFGYKSDCSCCTAERDGTENTGGKGLTGGEAGTALILA